MSLTGAAFLLAYVAGLALAVFRHPRFGLYTYLAVFYLHPPSKWWGAFLPDLRWAFVAAFVTLGATFRLPPQENEPKWLSSAPALLLIVFTVWLWMQNMWALNPSRHLELSILFTKYVVLYYLLFRLLDSPREVGNLLFAHVMGCTYLGWLVLRAPEGGGRLEGVGGPGIDDANAMGMFVATGALCAGMLILGDRSRRRWICLMAMPLLLNTIVQSGSRGAVLGLVAGGLVSLYIGRKALRLKLIAIGTAGLLLGAPLVPDAFWERMLTLKAVTDENAELDSSSESRLVLAAAQFRMAADYPLGTGHRGTAVLSPRYLDERWLTRDRVDPFSIAARSSHNTFLSALVEHSIIGLSVFAGLLVWLLKMVLVVKREARSARSDDAGFVLHGICATGSLVIVFVAGQFTDYINTEVQIWMFAVLGVLACFHALRQREVRRGAAGQKA
jgi:hypothetical protein